MWLSLAPLFRARPRWTRRHRGLRQHAGLSYGAPPAGQPEPGHRSLLGPGLPRHHTGDIVACMRLLDVHAPPAQAPWWACPTAAGRSNGRCRHWGSADATGVLMSADASAGPECCGTLAAFGRCQPEHDLALPTRTAAWCARCSTRACRHLAQLRSRSPCWPAASSTRRERHAPSRRPASLGRSLTR